MLYVAGIGVAAVIAAAAIGNLTDRIFRSPAPFRGHVVDWIEFPHWPVFNVADSGICVGVIHSLTCVSFAA